MEFNDVMDYILSPENEGGYVNDPKDPGGETNMGISKRAYPTVDIKNLTRTKALALYFQDYWLKAGCDHLDSNQRLMVMDCAVNQGVPTAVRLLQAQIGMAQDGVFGPMTLAAYKARPLAVSMIQYAADRALRYAQDPNFMLYGKGWMRRLIKTTWLSATK